MIAPRAYISRRLQTVPLLNKKQILIPRFGIYLFDWPLYSKTTYNELLQKKIAYLLPFSGTDTITGIPDLQVEGNNFSTICSSIPAVSYFVCMFVTSEFTICAAVFLRILKCKNATKAVVLIRLLNLLHL